MGATIPANVAAAREAARRGAITGHGVPAGIPIYTEQFTVGYQHGYNTVNNSGRTAPAVPVFNANNGDKGVTRTMMANATRLLDAVNGYDTGTSKPVPVYIPGPEGKETPRMYAARLENANRDLGLRPYGYLQPGIDRNNKYGPRIVSNLKLLYPGVEAIRTSKDSETTE